MFRWIWHFGRKDFAILSDRIVICSERIAFSVERNLLSVDRFAVLFGYILNILAPRIELACGDSHFVLGGYHGLHGFVLDLGVLS